MTTSSTPSTSTTTVMRARTSATTGGSRPAVKEPGTFLYNNNVVTVSTNANGEAVDYPGLNVQQSYTLTEIRDGKKTNSRSGMLTPPVNVGIRSTNTAASYASLAAAANYKRRRHGYPGLCRAKGRDLPGRPRIDLRSGRPAAVQQPSSGAPANAAGVNTTDGYNVHSLVIEIPVSRLTEGDDVLGIWTTAERRKTRVFTGERCHAAAQRTLGAGIPVGNAPRQRGGDPAGNEGSLQCQPPARGCPVPRLRQRSGVGQS